MEKILITGASGLIGQQLIKIFSEKGYDLLILSRQKKANDDYLCFEWDLERGYINPRLFEHKIDYIIHLAGAGIADKRWTTARKELIVNSRVKGIELLTQYLEQYQQSPKAFISAAAVGIYGNTGSSKIDEGCEIDEKNSSFLVQSCVAWENAILAFEQRMQIPTIRVRIGIVLSTKGGALKKMLLPYRFGIAGYFGNGKQYYPWIHIEDLCRMFLFLVEQNVLKSAVYNAVAPKAVSNKVLAKAIAKAKGQFALPIAIPSGVLRLAMGEMATVILHGANVQPRQFLKEGFKFQHDDLVAALTDLFTRKL